MRKYGIKSFAIHIHHFFEALNLKNGKCINLKKWVEKTVLIIPLPTVGYPIINIHNSIPNSCLLYCKFL